MKKNKPVNKFVKATAVVIGDRLITHKFTVVGDDRTAETLAKEFLRRQYPAEYDKMADVEGKFI